MDNEMTTAMLPLEMYRIKEYEERIKVPCEHCFNRGIVTHNCQKCGGKGVHNKTIKVWRIVARTETVHKIDRNKDGDLRYWVACDTYYPEVNKMLHFTKLDAEKECNRRNIAINHILEIDRQNRSINKKEK